MLFVAADQAVAGHTTGVAQVAMPAAAAALGAAAAVVTEHGVAEAVVAIVVIVSLFAHRDQLFVAV